MASPSCRLHVAFLLLAILSFTGILPADAQSLPDHLLFGPTQYLRTSGSPNSYTDSFTVPASVGAPFLLHIVNGNADGTSRISSATITINGVQVAGPNDFNQNVSVVDRTVTLQPTNALQVTLASGPAGFLTINVFGTKILPTPAALTPNPLTITAGATGTLTATLSPTPTTSGTLSASSANPGVATVPASIAFASGQSSVPVPVTAVAEGSSLITVSLNGGSASATVQVTPAPPTVTSLLSLTLTITQGGSGTLTVKISSAQGTDTTVTLSSSDPGVAFVPAQVTVPVTQTQATFDVNANTPGTAQITASLNGSSATSTITVTPTPPTIVSLLPPTNPVTLGATTTLTVTISAAQPTETVVAMSASPAGIVTVPASVTVPANQTQASITVGTVALGSAMVKASLNGSTADSAVQVVPPAPAVVSLLPSPLTVVVGATGTLTVTMNAAQLANTDVALTVDQGSVLQVPAGVTVPANYTQASFTVTGLAVGTAVVTATVGSTSQSATVHVVPPPPAVVSLLPNPLAIQQGATGAFTLTINAAQLADTVIPLTNSASTVAQAPASVTVPAGQTSVVFLVSGLTPGSTTVTATINATSVSATVQVTPPPTVVTGLTPATVTVPKGTPAVLHVTVSPASADPQIVTLTSSNETVTTVPATVTIPAGAQGADFPVMTVGVGTATITASLNGGTASATVVVTPAELVTLTLSPQTPTLFIGQTQAFTAIGTFTDGTTQDLTTNVTWTSSNQVVATINTSGVASALAAGTTTITAASGSTSASTTLMVLTPPALSLAPAMATVQVGTTLTLTVTSALPADVGGLTVTLTQSGTGSVTLPSPATVLIPEAQSSATFTATGVTAGSVTLTATAPIRLPASSTLTIQQPPTISGFSPVQGKVGVLVTITGQNFDPAPANNQVTFAGMPAAVLSATSTTLVATVPPAAATGFLTVTTSSGTAQSATAFTVIAITAVTVTPALATVPVGASQPFRATATFTDQTTLDVTSFTTWVSSNPNTATVTSGGLAQGVALGSATITGTLGGLSASGGVQVVAASGEPLPPDPSLVASPLDRTVATTLATATAFLYTGANPIQTGVAPGTIVPTRAAVLRGTVRGRDGFPIPGVTITILNHPEFGQTLTRPDGMFDMAVNGGGLLTVTYGKTGYLPAQRAVTVSWQDYNWLPEVVLSPLDPQVTVINLSTATTMQVARGSAVTDSDGPRQATLLFAPGTTAVLTLPGGGTQPLTTLSVRATEYTVGAAGARAMPAELPLNSAYTYAVEYSVDEATSAGATAVQFSQPVATYVENFLGLPVGTTIPSGAYDRAVGQWVGSSNGKIVKVLGVTGGLADLDTNNDNVADNLLGLSDAERQQVAALYAVGTSLWRVPVTHFSPYDYNFGPGFSPLDVAPALPFATVVPTVCLPCLLNLNSVIESQNQTLGERVALQGTPYALHYQSDRVPGRLAADALSIPLSGASVSTTLQRIDLEVVVAGRRFTQSFPPAPNQTFTFQWDGRDAYGRVPQGAVTYAVGVGYVYNLVYSTVQRWGANGSTPPLTPTQRRIEGIEWQRRLLTPARWDARAADGLGGWSLSVHHAYEPVSRALFQGDGVRRQVETLPRVITTALAGGIDSRQLAAGPDGSVYIGSPGTARVWRLVPGQAGVPVVAGTGVQGFSGDGGPATAAQLRQPRGVALGADGSLYITDMGNHRVRRVDPAGLITTVAGTGVAGFSGDDGPATLAQLNQPSAVAVGPDGSIYIADMGNQRIRRLGPDGLLTTFAGNGGISAVGANQPATSVGLPFPSALAVGPDGSVYIGGNGSGLQRVGVDGIIRAVTKLVASGFQAYPGDGGPAIDAVTGAKGVAVGPDGSIYLTGTTAACGIGCPAQARVYQIDPRGLITTVAGGPNSGVSGDGGPATQALMNDPNGVAVSPDGSLYIADPGNTLTRRVAPSLPGLAASDFLLAAEDGGALFAFNSAGKHLRTVDALTGAVTAQFGYDGNGRLMTVTDVAGQVTTVERDGSGAATALVAPGGQRTTLSIEANGYLAAITNPNNETVAFTYANEGLLASQTDARGAVATYTYDATGRLVRDDNRAGGFTTLARVDTPTSQTITLTSALNRVTSYMVEQQSTGASRLVNTDASGLSTTDVTGPDGKRTTTAPDGTVTTLTPGPDPRFGMQVPVSKSLTVALPSALTSTLTSTRTATLSNPADPLSLTTQTDTLVINGRTYSSVFNQAAKTITTTTPALRVSTVTLDALGRVIKEQVTGLEAVNYAYDAQGRLATITQGTGANARTSTLTYNTKNELTSVQDPLLRTVGFSYDLAGRITTQTLPDLRTIGYAYDGNGNVTSITPPGKPAHAFSYTPVDLEADYNPPDLGFAPRATQYSYNLDKQLTLVTRPDGQTLSLGYDTGGRLSTLTLPASQVTTYAYDATKGTLTSITAPGSTLSYIYDGSLLKTTTWAGTVAGNVSRVYDTNFRISSQSVNGANTVSFGYDTDSLLTSVGSLAITRNPQNGLITGSTLGVVTDIRTYSTFGETSGYTANVSGSPVFSTTFTRDKLGRITQKVETISGVTNTFVYTYDTAGRLTDVSLNGGTVSHYTYDSNGNRLSLTDTTGTTNGTYDAQDRLTQYGNLQFTYTANGELLTKSNPVLGQSASFTYDVLGNLQHVALSNGTTVDYVVDGQNRRIGKKVNGTLTQGYLYQNQLNPVAELDGAGNVVSRFVYGTKANVPDYMIKAGVTYRIVSDHLGSPRLIVNTTDGTVAQRMDFDEFGNITNDTAPGFQPFGFAGGLYDQHTGLTRFGARDYDAQVGKWTAKDPILFLGGDTNLYEYVLGDPINWIDPWGWWSNPTGGPIRGKDPHGRGEYGARRVRENGIIEKHPGVDYSGSVGGIVVAPISGSLELTKEGKLRLTTPKNESGIQFSAVLLHVVPLDSCPTGPQSKKYPRQVTEGEAIGTIEDLSGPHPGITPHAHLELYLLQNGTTQRVNPSAYIP